MAIIFWLGVPSLRWLESPKVSQIQGKGVRDQGIQGRPKILCVIDSLRNSFLKHKGGD